MDNQVFRQNGKQCTSKLTLKTKIVKTATITYDQQLEGEKKLGVEGAKVTKDGYNEFFNFDKTSKCGVLKCFLKKVGCKEDLANPKVKLDRRSPFNFHVQTDPKGYNVKLCYQCTNGFESISVDNYNIDIEADQCVQD